MDDLINLLASILVLSSVYEHDVYVYAPTVAVFPVPGTPLT